MDNYWQFREALPAGVKLVTVELSFSDAFEVPDAIQLHGDPGGSVMWQKERLLNIGIESLDCSFDQVAWVDADMIFKSPTWLEDAERLLARFPAVQMFERIHMTDPSGRIESSCASYAYKQFNPAARWKKPGGAWAYRREVLDGLGLYDKNIIGGGDQVMAASSVGDWSDSAFIKNGGAYRDEAIRWGQKFYGRVKGNISYLVTDVVHLFHGTRANRNYGNRHEILSSSKFDPASDITMADSGAWQWSTDKLEMVNRVSEYFMDRKEDG